MTITQLNYVLAVAEHLNFTVAAEKCFVTQPTLSMQIQKLEEELGVKIFDRTKQPVIPTEIGTNIIMQARITLREAHLIKQMINDHVWNNEVFLPTVGKRGAAIIEARGVSSAASAASAAIDHIRDWCFGSDDWATMGVPSDGSYGVPEGLVFGFPCDCKNGSYKIVQGIETTDYSREKIRKNIQELLDEAAAVKDML